MFAEADKEDCAGDEEEEGEGDDYANYGALGEFVGGGDGVDGLAWGGNVDGVWDEEVGVQAD